MKKKALLLASMGVLACTVGVTALAVGGANRLDAFPVKANPTEYSITFDASSESTTVEAVDSNYAICTTTAAGNKVGVVGYNNAIKSLIFKGASFKEFKLYNLGGVLDWRANDFDHITGYQIFFSGGSLLFRTGGGFGGGSPITSGTKYDVSLTPDDYPAFAMEQFSVGNVTVSSLTIWYSC